MIDTREKAQVFATLAQNYLFSWVKEYYAEYDVRAVVVGVQPSPNPYLAKVRVQAEFWGTPEKYTRGTDGNAVGIQVWLDIDKRFYDRVKAESPFNEGAVWRVLIRMYEESLVKGIEGVVVVDKQ